MARQWLKETLIRITEITISGRKINAATAYRWKSKGVRGHKLETTWAGGCCTSVEAVADFVAKLNAPQNGDQAGQITAKQRRRQAANASEQLDKAWATKLNSTDKRRVPAVHPSHGQQSVNESTADTRIEIAAMPNRNTLGQDLLGLNSGERP